MKQLHIIAAKWLVPAIVSGFALVGCGGGGGGNTQDFASSSFNIGGTLGGLNNSTSVQLAIGGSTNTVTVNQNGTFQFPIALPFNSSYAVTVAQQPANQTCTVSNASGSNVTAAVSNVSVNCVTNGYTVGGTLTGLAASTTLTLRNNNGDDLSLPANGSFNFATPVLGYAVTVSQQPAGQVCSVTSGAGTASANVTNVNVACAVPQFLDCPAGQVITGIDGRKGGIIDRLQLRCSAVVGSTADTANTTEPAASFVGGSGGAPFSPNFTCPTGEWISGVSGGNGSGGYPTAMASIQVTCSGGSQSPSYNSGGISAFNFSCPAGQKASGFLIGQAGGYSGFMQGITCQ